jgi:hypothetical protein
MSERKCTDGGRWFVNYIGEENVWYAVWNGDTHEDIKAEPFCTKEEAEAYIAKQQESFKGPADERKCRVCGCTDDDCRQCIEKTGEPCHWVEEDLCSACAGESPQGGSPDEGGAA